MAAGCADEEQPRLTKGLREEEQRLEPGVAGLPGAGVQRHCVHPSELNVEFSGVDSQAPVPGSVHWYCFIFLYSCSS